MMDQFTSTGWNLSEAGLQKVTLNGSISSHQQALKNALNTDLREISAGGLPNDLKSKFEVPKQGLVVQILKTRNIAAPKANQESKFAPRLLKIQFTDGQNQFSGIEAEHISGFSLSDTKPGTKICFRPGKVINLSQDLLLLKQNQFEILGGFVKDLVEKWTVAKTLSKYARGMRGISQAPPWIAFGQKIDRKSVDVNKKASLATDKGAGEAKEGEDAFDSQRKEAIAQAQKMASRKVFSDGAKKLVNHNVQKIIDKGFSEEEAKYALKLTRNDLGKAMANLKRGSAPYEGRGDRERGGRRGGGGGRRNNRDDEAEEHQSRPSEKISLFDFIGDKLPGGATAAAATITEDIEDVAKKAAPVGDRRFENNISSSFASRKRPPNEERKSNFDRSDRGAGGSHRNNSDPRGSGRGKGRGGMNGTSGSQRDRNHDNGVGYSEFNHKSHAGGGRDAYQERARGGPSGGTRKPPATWNSSQSASSSMNAVVQDMNRMNLNANQTNGGGGGRGQQQRHGNGRNQGGPTFNGSEFPNFDPNRTPGFLNKDTNAAAQKFLQQQTFQQQQPQSQQHAFHQQQQQAPFQNYNPQPSRGPPPHDNRPQRPESAAWKWNLGDRCMAKYWEDGKYYNAEITGISGRTIVVHFPEYGNYEEVLKDDCLPITAT